jgi:hypothetical protein
MTESLKTIEAALKPKKENPEKEPEANDRDNAGQ